MLLPHPPTHTYSFLSHGASVHALSSPGLPFPSRFCLLKLYPSRHSQMPPLLWNVSLFQKVSVKLSRLCAPFPLYLRYGTDFILLCMLAAYMPNCLGGCEPAESGDLAPSYPYFAPFKVESWQVVPHWASMWSTLCTSSPTHEDILISTLHMKNLSLREVK